MLPRACFARLGVDTSKIKLVTLFHRASQVRPINMKEHSAWARYQQLLIAQPIRMQILQAGAFALAGNVCNQCLRRQCQMDASLINFIAAFFRGGLTFGGPSLLHVSIHADAFPSIFAYSPIWSTRFKGLALKLPTTLFREKFVPQHLKGPFDLFVRFVWSVISSPRCAPGVARVVIFDMLVDGR